MEIRGKNEKNVIRKDVLTDTFGLSGVRDEPLVTFAAVASHCVLTAAVLTDAWFHHTLVQICKKSIKNLSDVHKRQEPDWEA